MNRFKNNQDNFDWSGYIDLNKVTLEDFDDTDLNKFKDINKIYETRFERIQTDLEYYQEQYSKIINKFGFSLNDTSQEEILFNFINKGSI
jgi:hypothetical protein